MQEALQMDSWMFLVRGKPVKKQSSCKKQFKMKLILLAAILVSLHLSQERKTMTESLSSTIPLFKSNNFQRIKYQTHQRNQISLHLTPPLKKMQSSMKIKYKQEKEVA